VISRVHVDFVRPYLATDKTFVNLPPETHNILGRPLTENSLINLAKTDNLELLYLDRLQAKARKARIEKPATRAVTLKQRKNDLQDAILDLQFDDNLSTMDSESEEDDPNTQINSRRVHFI
jgi:hypothetical protein